MNRVCVTNQIYDGVSLSSNSVYDIPKQWADKMILFVTVGGITGTLTVRFEFSPDNLNWYNAEELEFTAAGRNFKRVDNFPKFVRISFNLSSGGSVTGLKASLTSKG